MTLELFYVEGINSTDTMYFASKEEQDNFFLTEPSRISLNDFSFYPPHFKNTITLSSDDLNFNSNINYLRLSYNEKYYYYFISSVRYIAEDVIEIDIIMDVIQTYLFDIKFNYADVERRLINRWNGSFINRNYIRENFSTNDFVLENYVGFEDLCIIDVVSTNTIFNISKEHNDEIAKFEKLSTFANFNVLLAKPFSDGLVHYYIPYSKTKDIILSGSGQRLARGSDNRFQLEYLYNYGETTITPRELMNLIYKFSENPSVVAINLIPFNFLDNSEISFIKTENAYKINVPNECTISITNFITKVGTNSSDLRYDICLGFRNLQLQTGEPYPLSPINFEYNLNSKIKINKNTDKRASYSSTFIPQLLDSNYRKIEYGERISRNVFPLEEMTTTDRFFMRCYYLMGGGERGYSIFCDYRVSTSANEDPYLSTFVVSSKETFTLKNDAWKTYIAQNKATLSTGLAYKYLQASFKGGSQIYNNEKPFTGVTTFLNPYIEYLVNKENLEYTPDTVTQGNNVVDYYMLNSNGIVFRDFKVRDYERVAEIYTKIGFKVNEHYSGVNIINELNTRYYFNYIKCSDLNITLTILNDTETISNITERFRNGLRFWNMKECSEIQLSIGDIFHYDNIEKIYAEV